MILLFKIKHINYCIQVNNNGDVTFDTPLSQFTSQAFPINGSHKVIAPFCTDIDTRKGGYLWYPTTTEHTVLQRETKSVLYFLDYFTSLQRG